jgi:hypothetical protein
MGTECRLTLGVDFLERVDALTINEENLKMHLFFLFFLTRASSSRNAQFYKEEVEVDAQKNAAESSFEKRWSSPG